MIQLIFVLLAAGGTIDSMLDVDAEPNSIEESLQLARDKVIMAEESHGGGSGTALLDTNEIFYYAFLVSLIAGGLTAFFFIKTRK